MPAFNRLALHANAACKLFIDYFRRYCINEWGPSAWCQYRQSIRTNNDYEGWHNRLNRIGGNQPLGKNIDIVHDFKVVFISFKFYDCANCLHLRVSIINIMSFIFKAVCFDPFAA